MHPRGYIRLTAGRAQRIAIAVAAAAGLTLAVLPAVTGSGPGTGAVSAQAALPPPPQGVYTASEDTMRTGWDSNEPAMSPSAVKGFTEKWHVNVGGQVYAEPLVIGSTVFVATENDWLYGLNRTTGAVQWSNHLGSAMVMSKAPNTSLHTCKDLVPNAGITDTPMYDPSSGLVYFFAKIMSGTAVQIRLYGVDPASGTVKLNANIGGHPTNASKLTFNAQMQNERPGILVMNGAVYGAFASHCDRAPYAGYVVRYDLASKTQKLWTDESGVTYNKAGIWDGGGGLMTDSSGGIFTTSGNGVSPAKRAGTSPGGQLAESVIRLGVSSTGTLSAKDFFSPSNAPSLDAADTDFGSGGPTGLPIGTKTYPNVLAQAGKDGRIFLLNRKSLGGRDQKNGTKDASLFYTKAYGGEWGHPSVFEDGKTIAESTNNSANNYLFYVGRQDYLRVFRIVASSTDTPAISNVANSSVLYGYTSGSPTVTSNGNDPNSVVVWVVHSADKLGGGGRLDAYALGNLVNGTSTSKCTSASQCKLTPIWSSPKSFTAAKFTVPATYNGWAYVGTRMVNSSGNLTASGQVIGYSGSTAATPVNTATATFAPTSVSGTSTRNVSMTATKTVTLTGVSATTGATNAGSPTTNAFSVGQVTEQKQGTSSPAPVTFPVTVHKGDKITASVTFRPGTVGANTGALAFTTTASSDLHRLDVPLTAEATRPGLVAEPSSLPFQWQPDAGVINIPVGISVPMSFSATNFSGRSETVTSVSPPSGPFAASNLPRVGQVINPGVSLNLQATFSPTRPGPASSSVTISTTGGSVTVPLSGTGTAAVTRLTASPVHFGTVRVGKQATGNITVSNTGNTATTLKQSPRVPGPFAAPLKPAAGLPFNPDYQLAIPVKFTPTRKGSFTTHYTLIYTDVNGTHKLTVTMTGTAV